MLLHIVARGRIGRSPEAELVDRYIKRIGWPTRVTELPDTGGKLPPLEGQVRLVLMDEKGENLSSIDFARRLERWRDDGVRECRFMIGAADGFEDADRARADLLISYGRATWVGAMLAASGLIDLLIPRGGKSLVARVQAEAKVPVLAHLDGINHVYVDGSADHAMAERVVRDAKMRRTGICGAMETLLIDRAYCHAAALIATLVDAGCTVRGDDAVREIVPGLEAATPEDWDTEYLDAIASVALVDGVEAAMAHIAAHGSHHTDAILAEDEAVAERFLAEVDSAIVLWNASTQFADGGEFGLGAEIGIATGRLHARGPVALEGLTTYKWIGRGTGQIRAQAQG